MIISGGSRKNWRFFSRHLMRADENEKVTVAEMRGVLADNVLEAFREMDAVASGTNVDNFFYHANLNPREDEHLTPKQWERAADILEHELGLDGHARFIVEHEKEGRTHRHIIWSRIDPDTMTAVSDSFTYPRHEKASRQIEEAFGLEPVESVLVKDRDFDRPERRPDNWETFRGHKSKIDPKAMKAEITALWHEADSGSAFKAALEDAGYILAKGDRRDFCIVDPAGDEHSLARRIAGAKAADIRERLRDIDRDALPSVAEARELARAAADTASSDGAELPSLAGAQAEPAAPPGFEDCPPLPSMAESFAAMEEQRPLASGDTPALGPGFAFAAGEDITPGAAVNTDEDYGGWRRFVDRVRAYGAHAIELWRDESSGAPQGGRAFAWRLVEVGRKLWAEHIGPAHHAHPGEDQFDHAPPPEGEGGGGEPSRPGGNVEPPEPDGEPRQESAAPISEGRRSAFDQLADAWAMDAGAEYSDEAAVTQEYDAQEPDAGRDGPEGPEPIDIDIEP